MPVPEALTVITAALTIAKQVYGTATGIYEWIDGVKQIDKIVGDLADEVISLRETLQIAETLLGSEIVRHAACVEKDEESQELWYGMFGTLQDCRTSIDSLEKVLAPIRNSGDAAILRKFRLDLKDNEISTIRQQITFHSKRLHMSIQMVHLRISCLGPSLITASIDTRMETLQSLMQTQMAMLVELTKTAAVSGKVDQGNFNVCAKSLCRAGQSLLSTSASMFTGSQYDGSLAGDEDVKLAIQQWARDVSLPDTEVAAQILDPVLQIEASTGTSHSSHYQDEIYPSQEESTTSLSGVQTSNTSERLKGNRDHRADFLNSKGINVESFLFQPTEALKSIFGALVRNKQVPSQDVKGGIELLLELGADPTITITDQGLLRQEPWASGLPLINMACVTGWSEVLSAFLRRGVSPNINAANGITMIYSAASMGHVEMVQQLVTAGADFSAITEAQKGLSALHVAAREGFANIVRLLAENGAPIDQLTTVLARVGRYRGLTPMLLAIESHRQNVVKVLIEFGANVNLGLNVYGNMQPLFYACRKASCEIVQILIQATADVNAKSVGGTLLDRIAILYQGHTITEWRQLHIAVRYKRIVSILLDAGATPSRCGSSMMKKLDKKIERWTAVNGSVDPKTSIEVAVVKSVDELALPFISKRWLGLPRIPSNATTS